MEADNGVQGLVEKAVMVGARTRESEQDLAGY